MNDPLPTQRLDDELEPMIVTVSQADREMVAAVTSWSGREVTVEFDDNPHTNRPDAAAVLASLLDVRYGTVEKWATHILAALKDAGFLLLHESDVHRLTKQPNWITKQVCSCGEQFATKAEFFHHQGKAVAAVFDTMKVGM